MTSTPVARAAAVALCLASGGLVGCAGPHPFVRAGDAKSVQVTYSGDVQSAVPLARRHCAEYGLASRLVDASPDIAYFDCVPR